MAWERGLTGESRFSSISRKKRARERGAFGKRRILSQRVDRGDKDGVGGRGELVIEALNQQDAGGRGKPGVLSKSEIKKG